jgi:CRISPR system Cascade subunit CasA
LDGGLQSLSLKDTLLRAHEMSEFTGETPLVTAAILRLFLAVLHRLFGPEEEPDAWRALWERGQFMAEPIERYLTEWRDRFDLFDATHPFFQRAHAKAKPKSAISLIHDLASGNNPVLFDHNWEDRGVTLTPAQAARALVAAHAYGLGGLSPVSGERFTDGPAARGITFFVQGDTLFQTLMLNLVPYPVPDILSTRQDLDRPAWEMDDPYQREVRVPYGYLDYLTWQNRRILLMPQEGPNGIVVSEMLLGPGLRFAESIVDPLKHYRQGTGRGQGWLVLRYNEDRVLWRDSAAVLRIVAKEQRGSGGNLPPYSITWLHMLLDDGDVPGLSRQHTKRLLALGMANDQAKVEFYRSEQLPLPLALLQDQYLVTHLEKALALAEAVRGQLWGALSTLAVELLYHREGGNLGQQQRQERDALMASWGAERRYWAALELPFHDLVTGLVEDAPAARAAWAQVVRNAAWAALEAAAQNLGESTSALKAAVLARQQLSSGLGKVWKEHMPEPDAKEATT